MVSLAVCETLPAPSLTRAWTVFGPSPDDSCQFVLVAAYGSQADHEAPPSLEKDIWLRLLPPVSDAFSLTLTLAVVLTKASPLTVAAGNVGAVRSMITLV